MAQDDLTLTETLQWNPKWHWDPVPWWFIDRLDRPVLKNIAVIQLELQRDILARQVEAIEQVMNTIGKARK
jgi:hypothetical protein